MGANTILDSKSLNVKKQAPAKNEDFNSFLLSEPINFLKICGTIKPTKVIFPLIQTDIAVSKAIIVKILPLILYLFPKIWLLLPPTIGYLILFHSKIK